MGTVFQSHPRLYLHPLHPPSPAPVPSVIHPHPSTYQFLSVPTPPNPVDVVPQPRTLLAALTAAGHRRNVVFCSKTKIQCSAIDYIFSSHIRHFTAQFTHYSNACTRIFIVCKLSKAFPRCSREKKTNSIPGGSAQLPFPSPRYSRNICPHFPGFPAEFPPLPFPCRPLFTMLVACWAVAVAAAYFFKLAHLWPLRTCAIKMPLIIIIIIIICRWLVGACRRRTRSVVCSRRRSAR